MWILLYIFPHLLGNFWNKIGHILFSHTSKLDDKFVQFTAWKNAVLHHFKYLILPKINLPNTCNPATDTPFFTSGGVCPGFSKPGLIPLLVCRVSRVQQFLQVKLWCDTCWPLGGQHDSPFHPLTCTYAITLSGLFFTGTCMRGCRTRRSVGAGISTGRWRRRTEAHASSAAGSTTRSAGNPTRIPCTGPRQRSSNKVGLFVQWDTLLNYTFLNPTHVSKI